MQLEDEPKYQSWKKNIIAAGCQIKRVSPFNILAKKNGDLLFGLFDTEIVCPEGYLLHPYLLIRGDASIMVPLVINRDTGEEKFVMIQQRRIAHGNLSLEFPAGMLEKDNQSAASIAQIELLEETGLSIDPSTIVPLSDKGWYTSPGLQEEAVHFFGCVILLAHEEFNDLEGRLAGKKTENEHITVTLKTRDEAELQANSAQVLAGFYLFEKALHSGKMKKE